MVNGENGLGLWHGKQWFNHRHQGGDRLVGPPCRGRDGQLGRRNNRRRAERACDHHDRDRSRGLRAGDPPLTGASLTGSFNATGTQWTSATTLGATSTYTRAPNRGPVGCAPESSVSKPTSHAICVTCEASEGAACGPAVELSLTVALRHGKLHSQCNGGVALPAGSRVFSAVMRVGQADVAEPFCVGDS